MLSLAKLGHGREDYHLRAAGLDASEYYSERGEVAGRWLGGGAAVLGLEGRVQDQALLAVLAGYEPGAMPNGREWVGRRLVAPPRDGQRMPGIDACFKAPKSVSLLWAFGDRVQVGERRLDRVVELAHDEAVGEAMAYLERSAAKGRRGFNGLVQVESSGFVAASFRQRTSRANDPHDGQPGPARDASSSASCCSRPLRVAVSTPGPGRLAVRCSPGRPGTSAPASRRG